MAAAAIRVEGLAELNRAFGRVDRKMRTEMVRELREVAEPVRVAAQSNAASNIRNIGDRWSGMRVGASTRVVYVAPKARRAGGNPRKNLGTLLLNQMQAALDDNSESIVNRLEHWLDAVGSDEGF